MKKILFVFVVLSIMLSGCGVNASTPTPVTATEDPFLSFLATSQAQQQQLLEEVRKIAATPKPAEVVEVPEASASEAVTTEGQALGVQVDSFQTGNWKITTNEGVTSQMKEWTKNLKDPVAGWSEFPNVDFPKQGFKASNGLEYGMAESAFGQLNSKADFNIAAMHYRLFTGDYAIEGVDECHADQTGGTGCAIAVFNVGNVTAMYRGATLDYGFTVTGRYWNGDAMSTTVWALASNTYFNMTDANAVNRGANCSIPGGCTKVRFTWVVTSGNEVLLKATTTIGQ